ncbi:MAG: prolyl oligopeptidase family serine peptidase [Acidobacteria bacterium]|nr:prolyl oligopeptidase family serine peptidase [Acidobacteriota bacterium]
MRLTAHFFHKQALFWLAAILVISMLLVQGGLQRFTRAVAFLFDVQGEPVGDWAPLIFYPILRQHVLIEPPSFHGIIYQPVTDEKTAGIILVPGLHPQGVDDPRFDLLARAISRQGFTVLAPDISEFRRFRITHQAITAIVCASKFMLENVPAVDRSKVGLFGISFSAGPALIAASRAEIADKLAFVVSSGGYYHLRNPIEYVLTGVYWVDGQAVNRPPHPWARMIFALNNLDLIAPIGEQPLLEEIIRGYLRLDEVCAKEWEAELSDEGKEVLSLIIGPVQPQTYARMSNAIERTSEIAEAVSPSAALTPAALQRLQARIYLFHGARDDVIPCSETLQLAQALKERRHPAHAMLISHGVTHVDSARKEMTWYEKLTEGLRVVRFIMRLLDEK